MNFTKFRNIEYILKARKIFIKRPLAAPNDAKHCDESGPI